MSSPIEATGQLAAGHDALEPVWIDGIAYMPGQEVPLKDPLSEIGDGPTGHSGIEIPRVAERRFRDLGRGPTISELDI